MSLQFRAITDDEIHAFRATVMATFGDDADDADPGGDARFRTLIRPGAAWAAFDGPALVGTAATFDLDVGVPGGGSLPIAGLTMVTVRPTHRRRGILRELMALHLADAAGRGRAVSGLWASEGGIYGRFGYGQAAWSDALELTHTPDLRFRDPGEADALELVDEATARAQLPAIYAAATASRPGALRRTEAWWRERRFLELPWQRKGASRLRHVVATRAGEPVGYAQYRQRAGSLGGTPSGRVELVELHAVDLRAETSLWRFALSVDLFPTVSWWGAPVDCPLPWLLTDGRRVGPPAPGHVVVAARRRPGRAGGAHLHPGRRAAVRGRRRGSRAHRRRRRGAVRDHPLLPVPGAGPGRARRALPRGDLHLGARPGRAGARRPCGRHARRRPVRVLGRAVVPRGLLGYGAPRRTTGCADRSTLGRGSPTAGCGWRSASASRCAPPR
jgi:predicted N-acetyltransferase YhbS